MAVIRYNRYPGRFASPTTSYPQGAFKNKSGPNAKDGSYAEADWLNDWDGFFGCLLTQANMTANGTIDNALDSQYYDALASLFPLLSSFQGSMGATGYVQIPVVSSGKTTYLIINWAPWSGVTSTSMTSNVYEMEAPTVITWKKPFTNALLGVFPSVNDVSVNNTKSETVRYWVPTLSTVGVIGSCSTPTASMSGYVLAIGY